MAAPARAVGAQVLDTQEVSQRVAGAQVLDEHLAGQPRADGHAVGRQVADERRTGTREGEGTEARDAGAGIPVQAPSAQTGRLVWPLSPRPQVTRYFEAPESLYGPGHRGVDLAAAPGQQVLAADTGVVVFAGQVAGHGVVSLDHDGGLRTTYQPVTPTVTIGEQVYRGQPLGTVMPGHPGCSAPVCLHWGARRGMEYVDPLALTGAPGRIRLKPWGGEA